MPPSNNSRIVRFGPFEVDLQEGVLRKHGVRIRLQTQPFRVLAALLEKPGTAVTRDELRRRLWPDNTFVDFEHGLNAAVTRLRNALSDSAEQPRYIETLAKRGYRFSAQVDGQAAAVDEEAPANPVVVPRRRPAFWLVATLLLAEGGAGALLLLSNHPAPPARQPVPLTTFRGIEANPALSPDGNRLAFTWNGKDQDNFDIYVMPIDSDVPVRLTTDPADDVSPSWSPDGRTIAFVRRSGNDRGEVLLLPSSGGPEHKIREIRDRELSVSQRKRLVALGWSRDGHWIAASHREPGDFAERICLFSPTGEMRQLTSPPAPSRDHTPAFSPDGRTLVFSRLPGLSTSEIYVLPLDPNFQPASGARLVTTGKLWSVNPVWTRDGKGILYLSAEEPRARHELRYISTLGSHASERGILLNDEPSEITVSKHVVYSRQNNDTNIWRARIAPVGSPPAVAELFISSTWRDEKPRYSPDGKTIAFISSRSGSSEIWVSKADGSNPVRLTFFGGPLVGYMNWSPDGQWLVFHARPDGQCDVFVMPAAGGSPKRLTTNIADDSMPSYSPDGRSIYFSSARSGQTQIWIMPAAGGEAVQLTTSGGRMPIPSPDGSSLFYLALEQDGGGIRKLPVGGGESAKVAGATHGDPFGFAVTADGLYYPAPPHSGEQRFIRFFSFSTGESRPVAVASNVFFLGMSVSPDSKYVAFDQSDEAGSDLMLIENFRP